MGVFQSKIKYFLFLRGWFFSFVAALCFFNSATVSQQDGYLGHDWLTSTVFLIMAGNMDRSLNLLLNLSSLLTSAFIWPARIHASVSNDYCPMCLHTERFTVFTSSLLQRLICVKSVNNTPYLSTCSCYCRLIPWRFIKNVNRKLFLKSYFFSDSYG